ncbi:MAG: PQQ-binding-like beta-propeller repeat protein, partial [Holophaga sp.]
NGTARKESDAIPPVLPKPTREAWKSSLGVVDKFPCFDGSRLIRIGPDSLCLQSLDLTTGKVIWECPFVGKPELDPMLMGDLVVYVNGSYLLTVVDVTIGKERFSIQLESLKSFLLSAKKNLPKVLFPVQNENTLLITIFGKGKGGATGIVYAIDILSGQKRWEAKIPEGADLSPVVQEGRVIVGGAGRVIALDLQTGKQLWEVLTGANVQLCDGPLLGKQLHVVAEGYLLAIDVEKGREEWRTPLTAGTPPLGDGNRILYTEKRGVFRKSEWIVAHEKETGTKVWEFEVGSTKMPGIQDGKVYCNAYENLICLDLQTGKTLWKRALDVEPCLPISLAGETAYIATENEGKQHLYAVKLADGAVGWDYTFTGKCSSGLLLPMADGLLCPGEEGALIALK